MNDVEDVIYESERTQMCNLWNSGPLGADYQVSMVESAVKTLKARLDRVVEKMKYRVEELQNIRSEAIGEVADKAIQQLVRRTQ